MDFDVIAATLVVLGLAMLASVLGYRLGLGMSAQSRLAMFAIAMSIASLYASLLVGRLEWANVLPSGSAIFATNLTPVMILFSVGLACSMPRAHHPKRELRFALMVALSVLFFFAPLLRPWFRPIVSNEISRFDRDVCLQSHSATCGAAAAATLLHLHGIDVSEHAMIDACLTSRDGTEPLGLFRGLAEGTKDRHLRPWIAARDETDWKSLKQFPLVALVTFRHDVELNAGGFRRILGREADGHAVVVFGLSAKGDFLIGDPAVGRTVWDRATFHRRFSGQAIFLKIEQG